MVMGVLGCDEFLHRHVISPCGLGTSLAPRMRDEEKKNAQVRVLEAVCGNVVNAEKKSSAFEI